MSLSRSRWYRLSVLTACLSAGCAGLSTNRDKIPEEALRGWAPGGLSVEKGDQAAGANVPVKVARSHQKKAAKVAPEIEQVSAKSLPSEQDEAPDAEPIIENNSLPILVLGSALRPQSSIAIPDPAKADEPAVDESTTKTPALALANESKPVAAKEPEAKVKEEPKTASKSSMDLPPAMAVKSKSSAKADESDPLAPPPKMSFANKEKKPGSGEESADKSKEPPSGAPSVPSAVPPPVAIAKKATVTPDTKTSVATVEPKSTPKVPPTPLSAEAFDAQLAGANDPSLPAVPKMSSVKSTDKLPMPAPPPAVASVKPSVPEPTPADANKHPPAVVTMKPPAPGISAAVLSRPSAHGTPESTRFDVDHVALCTQVFGFGEFEPAANKATPGTQLLIYAEVRNFASHKSSTGYETTLSSTLTIEAVAGNLTIPLEFGDIIDRCQTQRTDFFCHYTFTVPDSVPPGEYVLRLKVRDVNNGSISERVLPLTVTASRPDATVAATDAGSQ